MPKRSNKEIASVAVPTVKQEEDGEKGFSLPVQLTKKQCVELFVETVNDSADKDGLLLNVGLTRTRVPTATPEDDRGEKA